ncbi:MAG: hypothetical protein LUO84_05070 [Methanomassiliicoccales archaeon]|nr:hypothetical protein [Methanomassiliicoccales archaeon]
MDRNSIASLLSRRDRIEGDDRSKHVSLATIIIGTSIVLTLFVLSLPLVDELITDTGIRWVFFLAVCILLALVLLRQTYPRRSMPSGQSDAGPILQETDGPIRKMASTIRKGIDGDPLSQLTVYGDLKRASIKRVMVRRRISQEEMNLLLKNREKLTEIVEDEDLVELMMTDLNRAFHYRGSDTNSKWRSQRFNDEIRLLVKKLEDWQ